MVTKSQKCTMNPSSMNSISTCFKVCSPPSPNTAVRAARHFSANTESTLDSMYPTYLSYAQNHTLKVIRSKSYAQSHLLSRSRPREQQQHLGRCRRTDHPRAITLDTGSHQPQIQTRQPSATKDFDQLSPHHHRSSFRIIGHLFPNPRPHSLRHPPRPSIHETP